MKNKDFKKMIIDQFGKGGYFAFKHYVFKAHCESMVVRNHYENLAMEKFFSDNDDDVRAVYYDPTYHEKRSVVRAREAMWDRTYKGMIKHYLSIVKERDSSEEITITEFVESLDEAVYKQISRQRSVLDDFESRYYDL